MDKVRFGRPESEDTADTPLVLLARLLTAVLAGSCMACLFVGSKMLSVRLTALPRSEEAALVVLTDLFSSAAGSRTGCLFWGSTMLSIRLAGWTWICAGPVLPLLGAESSLSGS